MSEINSIINLFNKISLQKIGEILSLIADLYISPVKSWRRVLTQRKSSLDYFVVFVLFYGVMLFLISWDIKSVIINIIINLILNTIPFLFLLIPLLLFKKLYNKRIKYNRLYRLFFLFKVQLFPLIYFSIQIADWAGIESPYLFSSISTLLFDLLIILVIPFLLNTNTKQKTLLICINYIFACFYVLFLNILLNSFNGDIKKLYDKTKHYTPEIEFKNMMREYNKTDLYLIEDYMFFYIRLEGKEVQDVGIEPQFATLYTAEFLIKELRNRYNKIKSLSYIVPNNEIRIDTLNKLTDDWKLNLKPPFDNTSGFNRLNNPNYLNDMLASRSMERFMKTPFNLYNKIYDSYKKDSLRFKAIAFKPFSIIEKNKLDSLKSSFNKTYSADLKLMDSLKVSAKYQSNREYAEYIYNYINQYNLIAKDSTIISSLLHSSNERYHLKFDNSYYLFQCKLDSTLVKYKLQGVIDRNISLNAKYEKSELFFKYFYFPVDKYLNSNFTRFDYTEEFENLPFEKDKD